MTPEPDTCFHLTTAIVREIHHEALARFGGLDGVRVSALLESAIAAPQATFGGRSVFVDLIDIAAAYLFYLCRNHPFVDGNKRTALSVCLVFLRLNGATPQADSPEWEQLVVDVATGALDRERATVRLRALV
jgi:death-on-curing protein